MVIQSMKCSSNHSRLAATPRVDTCSQWRVYIFAVSRLLNLCRRFNLLQFNTFFPCRNH